MFSAELCGILEALHFISKSDINNAVIISGFKMSKIHFPSFQKGISKYYEPLFLLQNLIFSRKKIILSIYYGLSNVTPDRWAKKSRLRFRSLMVDDFSACFLQEVFKHFLSLKV